MNKKILNLKYYKRIIKILFIFVLVSIINYFHSSFFIGYTPSFKDLILKTLSFTAAKYSWYVEMYIGLFLLIPFLNIIYNNLKNKREKQILLLTLFILTILPSIINIYNFSSLDWWIHPYSDIHCNKIFPSWWTEIYPITYYFIGAYICEYNTCPSKRNYCLLIISLFCYCISFGMYNLYRSYGHIFIQGVYQGYASLASCTVSVILFIVLLNINSENWNYKLKAFLHQISDLCFGAYLISAVADDLIYNSLYKITSNTYTNIKYLFPASISVFIISLMLSFLINILYKLVVKIFNKIKMKQFN